MKQGTPEWFASRIGIVTASRVDDVLAKTKSGPSASRKNYLAEKVCEILTGKVAESYTNDAMQRGIELEPLARAAYEAHTGHIVTETGLMLHPTIPRLGASPDGLIDDALGLEIKCMGAAGHLEAIRNGLPSKYIAQVQTQMLVTGRPEWDFVAFNPDFPPHLQLVVRRIKRDDAWIAMAEPEILAFISELESTVAELQQRKAA